MIKFEDLKKYCVVKIGGGWMGFHTPKGIGTIIFSSDDEIECQELAKIKRKNVTKRERELYNAGYITMGVKGYYSISSNKIKKYEKI